MRGSTSSTRFAAELAQQISREENGEEINQILAFQSILSLVCVQEGTSYVKSDQAKNNFNLKKFESQNIRTTVPSKMRIYLAH